MKTASSKRDAAAEWHWGVLALVLGAFAVLAAAAALRRSWVALAIAVIGLGMFGKAAWRKSQALQTTVQGNWIEGNGFRFQGQYPVVSATLVKDRIVVIYDRMAFAKDSPARNLFCYDLSGKLLWRAPDIGMGATDAYTNVIEEEPLWVGNFASFNCRIDMASGMVLEKRFTK